MGKYSSMKRPLLALVVTSVGCLLGACGNTAPPSGGLGGAAGMSSGGAPGTGGASTPPSGSGGASGVGGATNTAKGGAPASGGQTAAGGTGAGGGLGSGGQTAPGGTGAGGASPGSGGVAGTVRDAGPSGTGGGPGGASSGSRGGTTGAGGSNGTGGATSMGGAGGSSGTGTATNANPFGCKFGWGLAANLSGSLAAYSYLQFMTVWIESGMNADGTFNTCSGCNWIKSSVASTSLIPVYYAYIIGFLGHANGLPDGNQTSGQSLTTGGAALIKSKRSQIVQAYGNYAKQSYAVWPTKPLVWLMEGDFIQYNDAGQSSPLSMSELTQLAADISSAIKSNMPNAVVAWNHTVWNSDQETKDFWNGMKAVNYDLAWTTGVANNNGYIPSGTNSSTYNGATAKYSVVHQLSGKSIIVDDGCGANTNEDWSKGPASVLNARIADGVIGFSHCVTQSSNYQSQITAIMSQANATCQ
jgi:hypothetical protein